MKRLALAVPLCGLLALAAFLIAPPARSAPSAAVYRYMDLHALAGLSPTAWSDAYDVNTLGHAVGLWKSSSNAEPRAAFWVATAATPSWTDLGVPAGCDSAVAESLNDADEVVGSGGATGIRKAFIWDAVNGMRDLNVLYPGTGWEFRHAREINNNRQVAGEGTLGGELRGFLLDLNTGTVADLGLSSAGAGSPWVSGMNGNLPTPQITAGGVGAGGANGYWLFSGGSLASLQTLNPFDINDSGQVAGSVNISPTGGAYRAFFWDGASPLPGTMLNTPKSGSNFYALALNNSSPPLIVGRGLTNNVRAFQWQGPAGKAQDLNAITSGPPKGTSLVTAVSVSNTRYVVGQGNPPNGGSSAYLLAPQ